jgi:hypothetical protein
LVWGARIFWFAVNQVTPHHSIWNPFRAAEFNIQDDYDNKWNIGSVVDGPHLQTIDTLQSLWSRPFDSGPSHGIGGAVYTFCFFPVV